MKDKTSRKTFVLFLFISFVYIASARGTNSSIGFFLYIYFMFDRHWWCLYWCVFWICVSCRGRGQRPRHLSRSERDTVLIPKLKKHHSNGANCKLFCSWVFLQIMTFPTYTTKKNKKNVRKEKRAQSVLTVMRRWILLLNKTPGKGTNDVNVCCWRYHIDLFRAFFKTRRTIWNIIWGDEKNCKVQNKVSK